MSDPLLSPEDEALLALARQLPRPVPGVADSARLKHGLEASLARDVAGRRRAISPALVLVAVVAAGAASAGAALLVARARPTPEATTTTTATATATSTPAAQETVAGDDVVPAVDAPAPVTITPPPTPPPTPPITQAPTPAIAPTRKPTLQLPPPASISAAATTLPAETVAMPVPASTTTPSPSRPPPAPTWQERVDDLQSRGDRHGAAVVAAAAVVDSDDPRAAGVALWALAGSDPSVIDVLDPLALRLQGSGYDDDDDALARVLRLGCQLRLRHRRDAGAITTCRTFGQRFPADPTARALAFAAGGLAEELGDLRAAVDEYTRAIVLAPLGSSGADALLARARVRTRLGDLDEARADLRMYLQKERRPAATHDDEVQGLARALQVALP